MWVILDELGLSSEQYLEITGTMWRLQSGSLEVHNIGHSYCFYLGL